MNGGGLETIHLRPTHFFWQQTQRLAGDEQELQRLGDVFRELRETRVAERQEVASRWDEEKFAAPRRCGGRLVLAADSILAAAKSNMVLLQVLRHEVLALGAVLSLVYPLHKQIYRLIDVVGVFGSRPIVVY